MAESYKVPKREPSKVPQMTPEEYLMYESNTAGRHEYVSGYIFAMTGATDAHNVVCGNLFALLHTHLNGTGCIAYIGDMKARIEAADSFYYPDIMVTCEPFEAKSLFKKSPCLIIEVSSPSTKHVDRREKLVAYRQIETLREYLIVSQDRPKVEYFRKTEEGKWIVTIMGKEDTLKLISLPEPLDVPVEKIYRNIQFTSAVHEDDEEYEYLTSACVPAAEPTA